MRTEHVNVANYEGYVAVLVFRGMSVNTAGECAHAPAGRLAWAGSMESAARWLSG